MSGVPLTNGVKPLTRRVVKVCRRKTRDKQERSPDDPDAYAVGRPCGKANGGDPTTWQPTRRPHPPGVRMPGHGVARGPRYERGNLCAPENPTCPAPMDTRMGAPPPRGRRHPARRVRAVRAGNQPGRQMGARAPHTPLARRRLVRPRQPPPRTQGVQPPRLVAPRHRLENGAPHLRTVEGVVTTGHRFAVALAVGGIVGALIAIGIDLSHLVGA